MLAVAPLRNTKDERDNGESFSIKDDIPDFSGDNLLDSIDFDDLFDGMEDDDDLLPALEIVDPDDNNIMRNTFVFEKNIADENNISTGSQEEEEDKVNSGSGFGSSGLTSSSLHNQGDGIVSKRDEAVAPPKKADHKGRKSSKNNQGKRKVKVDWTPELHRRLVQAVEQLGVDKAVPSRILELMGIDCLTRRNIASHLQVPNSVTPGTPCFPPPTRFPAPPVRGIPPHAMYKVDPSPGVLSAPAGQTCPYPPSSDFHPSKESIDAAIGDVLSKPWLPRPLGLKPPSTDSVVVELHRRGIEKIPPTCA